MSYIGNQPTQQAFVTDQFSGNGSTVAFTMSVAPATTTSVLVAVSGVLQDPSTYAVSGKTLTFSAAPPTGTGNISCRYMGIPASGVTTTAYRTVSEFTATTGQTSFSVPSYTVGYIDVYRNGAKLGTADFTATTGTTVVLASGANAGDLIQTVSFYVSSVLNAIPNTAGSVSQSNLAAGVTSRGPLIYAYAGTAVSLSVSTNTRILFDSEIADTNNNYASSRFTPSVAGWYMFSSGIRADITSNTVLHAQIWKNGAPAIAGNFLNVANNQTCSIVSGLAYANGTTDFFETYCYSALAGNTSTGSSNVYFQANLVRSA